MFYTAKPIKPLHEIILPFQITPKVTIQCQVNGRKYYYPQGITSNMSKEAYEALLFTDYGKELEA